MKKLNCIAALLASLLALTLSHANAGQTEWYETDGGNIRLVASPYEDGDVKLRGFIEIDLKDGWRTYWRNPGFGGIPPSITALDDLSVANVELKYPTPEIIRSDYGADAGYLSAVQIPFEIDFGNPLTPGKADLRVMVGICEEICIPAFADFSLPVTKASVSTPEMQAVQAAFSVLPVKPELVGATLRVSAIDNETLEITVETDVHIDALFASSAQNEQFFLPKLMTQAGSTSLYRVKAYQPFKKGTEIDFFITGKTDAGDFEAQTTLNF